MRFRMSRNGTSSLAVYMVMSAKLLTRAVPGTLERFWSIMLSTTMLALPEANTLNRPGLPATARISEIFIGCESTQGEVHLLGHPAGREGRASKGVAVPSGPIWYATCSMPLVTNMAGTLSTML